MTAVVLTGWAAKAYLLWLVLLAGAVVWVMTSELADWLGERAKRRCEHKIADLRQAPEDDDA